MSNDDTPDSNIYKLEDFQRNGNKPPPLSKEEADELLKDLAKLPPGIEFAKLRSKAARWLGVRCRDVDVELRARSETSELLYPYWAVASWPEEVDGDALVRNIVQLIRRYVVCSHDDALAVALWIVFAWAHDAATFSPMLVVTSAEPNSGKTTLLSIIAYLTPRPIRTVEITEAALFRALEKYHPTFVIDEFDSVLANQERAVLRSIFNSGHTRGDGIMRVNKDKDFAIETFSTFGPKAMGMIERRLPDAFKTRCIFIELRRRKKAEKISRFQHNDTAELADLRSRLCRWSADNVAALRNADPAMPDEFENRSGDNWRMQFAIADFCGEEWSERARAAAVKTTRASDSSSAKARLLAAIRKLWPEGTDAMHSHELVEKLTSDPTSEWAEWSRGKPITQNRVAKMLENFHIFPDRVRVDGRQARGYLRTWFEDAWERYL
jgi:putative DNA primase/helicase